MSFLPNGAQLDNALVRQKDAILRRLNSCDFTVQSAAFINQELDAVEEVLLVLQYNRELWRVCGYSYKGVEIAERCRAGVREMKENYLDRPISGEKTRKRLQAAETSCVMVLSAYVRDKQRTVMVHRDESLPCGV